MTIYDAFLKSIPVSKDIFRIEGEGLLWNRKKFDLYKKLLPDHSRRFPLFSSIFNAMEPPEEIGGGWYRFQPEDVAWMKRFTFSADPYTLSLEFFETRRPYFRLRGKPVTEEQALDVIRHTDYAFHRIYDALPLPENNPPIDISGLLYNDWFPQSNTIYPPHGWIHPDGILGIDAHSPIKYPYMDEILPQIFILQRHFPFLNFILAITDWNELPPYAWGHLLNSDDNTGLWCMEYPDFPDHIVLGVQVKREHFSLLSPRRAKETYIEYVQKFAARDPASYVMQDTPSKQKGQCLANIPFLIQCLEGYGYSREESLKIAESYRVLFSKKP